MSSTDKKVKHIPQRTCIVCRKTKDKAELLRVVRSPEGLYSLDKDGRAAGRGAYVCDKCLEDAVKKRALNRVFKTEIPSEVYDELLKAGEGFGK